MDEQAAPKFGEVPNTSMMTACEVLTWIAFGRPIRQESLHHLFNVTLGRWRSVPATPILEALEARAGLAGDGPYYAIRSMNFPERSLGALYWHDAFSPDGPRLLREIRGIHRRTTGRLLSFGDIAHLLRGEIEADAETSKLLDSAKAQLRDRLAGGTIAGFGTLMGSDGYPVSGGRPQQIDNLHFMHPAVIVNEWDRVGMDRNRPPNEWIHLQVPRFGIVQFRTEQVLRLWPPSDVQRPATPLSASSALLNNSIAMNALAAMRTYAESFLAARGIPPKRDDAARVAHEKTGYPVRKARTLHRELPVHLRNPGRKVQSP